MNATPTRWIVKLPTVRRRVPIATPERGATLKRGGIYILPTRQGLIFFAILAVMLLAAINYNNSMTYALTFLLGSVAILSMFHTYLNLVGITLIPTTNSACFAGEEGGFSLIVGDSGIRDRHQIRLSTDDDEDEGVVKDVSRGNSMRFTLTRPCPRRGLQALGRVTLSSQYPLNLFRAWSYIEPRSHVVVYPKPSERTHALPYGQASGDRQATNERGSDDFHGLNNYQYGDSPRHIHWKSWAQGRELVTKQFHRNRSTELWLEWDRLEAGDTEERLGQLCRWVLDADSRGLAYGLRIPGTHIQPDRGEAHRHRCLSALARFGNDS